MKKLTMFLLFFITSFLFAFSSFAFDRNPDLTPDTSTGSAISFLTQEDAENPVHIPPQFCQRRCRLNYFRELRLAQTLFNQERLQCLGLTGFLQTRCMMRARAEYQIALRAAQATLRHCLLRCNLIRPIPPVFRP